MTPATEHTCPAKGCEQVVARDLLVCKSHWFALPKPLRRQISDAWQSGELALWAAYRKQALDILAA